MALAEGMQDMMPTSSQVTCAAALCTLVAHCIKMLGCKSQSRPNNGMHVVYHHK